MGDWPASENFDRATDWLLPDILPAPYWYWPPGMDTVPDGAGAFAVNRPVNKGHVEDAVEVGIFCQGLINFYRRFNGKIVPRDPNFPNPSYDGGTWANQRYFADYLRPFSRYVKIPRGALIGRYFRWAGAPGFSLVLDQGHVTVLLEEQNLAEQKPGLILHSHPAVGGVAKTNLGNSHAGWYYEYWIAPEDWLNHNKGRF
jgi:hypothetical protein